MLMRAQNIPDYDFEHSELLLFHVRVLEELGEWSEALSILDPNAKDRTIVDRVAIMETRGLSLIIFAAFGLTRFGRSSSFAVQIGLPRRRRTGMARPHSAQSGQL